MVLVGLCPQFHRAEGLDPHAANGGVCRYPSTYMDLNTYTVYMVPKYVDFIISSPIFQHDEHLYNLEASGCLHIYVTVR